MLYMATINANNGGSMKVLVTGGCGFIGSHVVDNFIAGNHDVVIIDDLSTGKMENKNNGARLHVASICDDAIEEIFKNERPDIINHHAAQISVPLSTKIPLFDAEVNIKGTIRLLELSKKYGVKKFIFASTGGAIYGDADKVPTAEDYVPEPASPYAISKFSSEKYIRYYYGQYGLNYTVLRYSNVYGPRQIPHGEAGVVSIFTESLLAGEHPTLYHFAEEEKGMVRDYCYVKDIARASLIAAEKGNIGIYNIGTGKGTYTLDLYRNTIEALRKKGVSIPEAFNEPRRGAVRAGEIRVSTLDVSRAKEKLGWEPQYSLKDGLIETVEWYLNR
jgi:UDP-glucose 4-epimerase